MNIHRVKNSKEHTPVTPERRGEKKKIKHLIFAILGDKKLLLSLFLQTEAFFFLCLSRSWAAVFSWRAACCYMTLLRLFTRTEGPSSDNSGTKAESIPDALSDWSSAGIVPGPAVTTHYMRPKHSRNFSRAPSTFPPDPAGLRIGTSDIISLKYWVPLSGGAPTKRRQRQAAGGVRPATSALLIKDGPRVKTALRVSVWAACSR